MQAVEFKGKLILRKLRMRNLAVRTSHEQKGSLRFDFQKPNRTRVRKPRRLQMLPKE